MTNLAASHPSPDSPGTSPLAKLPARWVAALDTIAVVSTISLIVYALWWAFAVVPNERIMGPVQRIFYFHVGSAIATYCAVALVLIGSLGYLATRDARFDALGESAAEVGFVFCSAVLFSGMIWARPIWNTWFNWEPRLASFLFLWLILLSLNLLRMFAERDKVASHCAVLGIISALTVPVVVFSIKLLPQIAQLHPQVVENRGLREPLFRTALAIATGAMVVLQFVLVWFRTRLAFIKYSIQR